jgi:hypothetical protein
MTTWGCKPAGSGLDEAFAADGLDLRCMRTLLKFISNLFISYE